MSFNPVSIMDQAGSLIRSACLSKLPHLDVNTVNLVVLAGQKAISGEQLSDDEIVYLIILGFDEWVMGNKAFIAATGGRCNLTGSLLQKATTSNVDTAAFNQKATDKFNKAFGRLNSLDTLALAASTAPSNAPASISPVNVPGSSASLSSASLSSTLGTNQAPSTTKTKPAGTKPAAHISLYGSIVDAISHTEEAEMNHNDYSGLRLEQKFPFMFYTPVEQRMHAVTMFCIDQAELDNREKRYLDEIHDLRRESQARFFKSVGMTLDPSHCYPGGYRGKSGKVAVAETQFNDEIFSTRRQYYHEQFGDQPATMGILEPKKESEIRKGIDTIKKASKTSSLPGAIGSQKRQRTDI